MSQTNGGSGRSDTRAPPIDCYIEFPPQLLGTLKQGGKKWELVVAMRDFGRSQVTSITNGGSRRNRKRKARGQRPQALPQAGVRKSPPQKPQPKAATAQKKKQPISSNVKGRPPPPKRGKGKGAPSKPSAPELKGKTQIVCSKSGSLNPGLNAQRPKTSPGMRSKAKGQIVLAKTNDQAHYSTREVDFGEDDYFSGMGAYMAARTDDL